MDTVRRATTADIDSAAAAQAEAFRGKTQDYLDAYGKGRWFQGQPIETKDVWVLDEDGEIGVGQFFGDGFPVGCDWCVHGKSASL